GVGSSRWKTGVPESLSGGSGARDGAMPDEDEDVIRLGLPESGTLEGAGVPVAEIDLGVVEAGCVDVAGLDVDAVAGLVVTAAGAVGAGLEGLLNVVDDAEGVGVDVAGVGVVDG